MGSEAATEDSIDRALKALADPTRRGILRLLGHDEQSAGAIAASFPTISRPAVSQHLAVLEAAALVTCRRQGTRRLYRTRHEGLAEAWAFLDQMWRGSLLRLKKAAERAEAEIDHRNDARGNGPASEQEEEVAQR